jgi:hypothetical protein
LRWEDIVAAEADVIERLRTSASAQGVLLGVMSITPLGVWDTEWRLLQPGSRHDLRVEGTSFDRSMRRAIEFSARILAGLD